MTSTIACYRAFSQLVWLLVYRPSSTVEQKGALRAALASMRERGVVLSLAELNRAIATASQDDQVPVEAEWLSELSMRMAGHSAGVIAFEPATKAADVLGVARALAGPVVQGDEGAAFDATTQSLGLTTVTIRLGRAGFVRGHTPIATMRALGAPPARTPAMGIAGIDPAANPAGAVHVRGAVRDPAAEGLAGGAPAPDATATPNEEGEMLEAAFSRTDATATASDLLRRLEGEARLDVIGATLHRLVRMAEDGARDGDWESVAPIVSRLVALEAAAADANLRRTLLIHVRRLCTPTILRGLGQLLGTRRDSRPALEPVFARAGDEGAEILIELLVSSNVASARRAYRSALARCPAAAEPLRALLGDERWFVVRNAAELLGEMRVESADAALAGALEHPDARVRRSAAASLAQLGTSRGVQALQLVLGDRNAAVRLQAVHGLAAARSPRSVPALLRALDEEADPTVQQALLRALGSHPTDASVARLVQAAQPRSLLHRKAPAYRVAAVYALAEAGTAAALACLRQLQSDRDRAVRAAAEHALAERAQGVLVAR